MMPAVLRQSGPKYMRNGAVFTPRAVIGQCEVCGFEHAPHGTADEQGKRLYWCRDHVPTEQARAGDQPKKREG
ncbi:hypothetical protein VE26_05475 [Devosia chinhatensis]|uniref:Uncharacterized protein n=1 Tax=Devosia chinhatensis TaxID=429727 RepID=A0A0F5FKR0_9HYPH|nr:hypothetical protein VE26_05475 [Devosia chinhatensis]